MPENTLLYFREPNNISSLAHSFHMYWCQINFAISCATSSLGILLEHLSYPILLVCSVYRFQVHYHTRIILHRLGVSLPYGEEYITTKKPVFSE